MPRLEAAEPWRGQLMTKVRRRRAASELAALTALTSRLSRLLSQVAEILSSSQCEWHLSQKITHRAPMGRRVPPDPFNHIGQLARWLREAAGLTRQELQFETGIAASTIRNIELARHRPTKSTRRKLLRHPAMALLPGMARQAGLSFKAWNSGCEATSSEEF